MKGKERDEAHPLHQDDPDKSKPVSHEKEVPVCPPDTTAYPDAGAADESPSLAGDVTKGDQP